LQNIIVHYGINVKEKFIKLYADIAKRVSELSYAVRLKVGAIIVKDDRIISIGYNGMPSGWDNGCEYTEFMPINDPTAKFQDYPFTGNFWINGHSVERRYRLKTKPEVLHAESNALAKLAKSNESGDGADLFITHSPCIDCAKLIYQSGIRRVYFGTHYRDDAGIKFLEKSGVEVISHG
jgi:dCMP deaminase